MDSVQNNTPPPEINKCNVIYKGQEYYSPTINSDTYVSYQYNKQESFFILTIISFILIVICCILVYITIKRYRKKKSIIGLVIAINTIFIIAIFIPFTNTYNYLHIPNDLKRPCFSSKVNAILYSDEQLKDIYMKK
jgi:hypothetical protein